MIATLFLWERLIKYAAKYQLQAPDVDNFNSALEEVQVEAMTILGTHYQANEKVRSLLTPWVRRIIDVSDGNGQLLQPQRVGVEEETTEAFYRLVGMGVTDISGNVLYGISPSMEAEIMEYSWMPQRKPDLTKSRVYYIPYDDVIQLYPQTQIPYILFYLVYPSVALLAFTYSVVNGEYIQTYDPVNTVDLLWDKDASNLLLYMLLEKYGISSRDDLLAEFGKFGVQVSLGEGAKA